MGQLTQACVRDTTQLHAARGTTWGKHQVSYQHGSEVMSSILGHHHPRAFRPILSQHTLGTWLAARVQRWSVEKAKWSWGTPEHPKPTCLSASSRCLLSPSGVQGFLQPCSAQLNLELGAVQYGGARTAPGAKRAVRI